MLTVCVCPPHSARSALPVIGFVGGSNEVEGKIGRGMLMLTQLPDTTVEVPEYEYVTEKNDHGKTVS